MSSTSTKTPHGLPPFEALPLREGDPYLSAWGLYGADDQLGALHRLSDEHVAHSAKTEILSGVRIGLDAPLNLQTPSGKAFFGREIFHQEVVLKGPRVVNDDVWVFNSQVSTQWDGLRHFAYQKEGLFYNGTTARDIHGSSLGEGPVTCRTSTRDPGTEVLGIQEMAKRGIIGRAVLLDYHSWRLAQPAPREYDPFASASISLEELLAVAKAQGTEIRFGDILFTRTETLRERETASSQFQSSFPQPKNENETDEKSYKGYKAVLNTKTDQEVSTLKDVMPPHFGGVEQSEELVKWIWEHFSAVAGDQPSFECWPSANPKLLLHEVLLAGWGMPIGELFDLESLAEHCRKVGRWSFFLSSEVCHVTGGVASPPNAVAIF
ncbi:hypothetical protein HYALB_00009476 [Hymenoscyphus albidus]|uniref:Cyclase n=1 Tax=Hymenoscyphus albidus TaxID=595503 RepID=A0A9N9LXL7_9HELO|nr:hypothetical protein HYALB_00009476 [Hymenoscyphus albidus]